MSAATKLMGLTLKNDWKVVEHIARHPNGSGGTFSESYRVERAGQSGFLKAFDFSNAFRDKVNTTTIIQTLTSAYNFEREILDHCKQRRLTRVVLAIDHGDVQVPDMGEIEGRVFYLIFEMAKGDVRRQIDASNSFDSLWCMRALKDVSLGLYQVHKEMIAHQDVKPSNVLNFPDGGFKVADFGRSSMKGRNAWYDEHPIAGDKTYAPPELLYGYIHPDFVPRRMGCDLYMLGNLVSFMFSGVNITSAIFAKLDTKHHPHAWTGSYEEVLPYLQSAFAAVLEDQNQYIREQLVRDAVIDLIKQLCNPDIALRGHPKGIAKSDQYSLERYVTLLDLLTKRLTVDLRILNRLPA
jgi:serine/threonine protein kinase